MAVKKKELGISNRELSFRFDLYYSFEFLKFLKAVIFNS
jgi:hypothetical protein